MGKVAFILFRRQKGGNRDQNYHEGQNVSTLANITEELDEKLVMKEARQVAVNPYQLDLLKEMKTKLKKNEAIGLVLMDLPGELFLKSHPIIVQLHFWTYGPVPHDRSKVNFYFFQKASSSSFPATATWNFSGAGLGKMPLMASAVALLATGMSSSKPTRPPGDG